MVDDVSIIVYNCGVEIRDAKQILKLLQLIAARCLNLFLKTCSNKLK